MSDKVYVMLNWEQDWDIPTMYYTITETGKIIKYDVETDTVYEYEMERVVH